MDFINTDFQNNKYRIKWLSFESFQIVDIQNTIETPMMDSADGFDNVLAAIILSVIAAICLVLLGILLVS